MNMKLRNIPFSPPDMSDAEVEQVAEALQSGWITTGPKTKEFEKLIALVCSSQKVVCLNSATAAMEMALRLIGVGPEDEVIVPAYTYTATASVTQHVGCKVVMVDSQKDNVEMDYDLSLPDAVAYYDNNEQTIFIKREVGDSVALTQSLAQELAHAQLSIDNDTYSRREMGFQAVCIGYMLCKKYGVDTKNFAIDRIPQKYKDMDAKDIRKDLTKMRNALSNVNSRISDELYKTKQERSKGVER